MKSFQIPFSGGKLTASYFPAANRSVSALVILTHGFRSHRFEDAGLFVETARKLASAGINALSYDSRGCGESSGSFYDTTALTKIADLEAVISWAKRKKFSRIGLLGMSLGGAATLCAAHDNQLRGDTAIKTVVVWSSVPELRLWAPEKKECRNPEYVWHTGPALWRDFPDVDAPEAYLGLEMPTLHIQGDRDLPYFQKRFTAIHARLWVRGNWRREHRVLPGADHTFAQRSLRLKAIRETVVWFRKYL